MSHSLIPVETGSIAGVRTQIVDARKLHAFLEVGRYFANWIQTRIHQYGFEENQDYILICQNGQIKSHGGDRKTKTYYLTLDMAKELAMVERNDKGRQARRYFIECERQLQGRAVVRSLSGQQLDDIRRRVSQISACFTHDKPVRQLIHRRLKQRHGVTRLADLPETAYFDILQQLKFIKNRSAAFHLNVEDAEQLFCRELIAADNPNGWDLIEKKLMLPMQGGG